MSQEASSALRGRIALVTGASAGIGRACAIELASQGALLILNARRADRLRELAAEIAGSAWEGRVALAPGDAADEGVIASMFEASRRGFGRGPDLVVVNAGRGLRGSPISSDPGQWEEVIRINVLGAARLLRAAAESMIKEAAGGKGASGEAAGLKPAGAYSSPAAHEQARAAAEAAPSDWPRRARDIVMLSSTVGRHISPFSSLYGGTKFAVTSIAEAARRELAAKGIRVSSVHPGVVRSEFQEAAGYDPLTFGEFMDRIGPVLTPEDVARVIGFIVSQPPEVCVNDVMLRPTRQEYP